jgi:SAM-dependent methyltransferase
MNEPTNDEIRNAVREQYGSIARGATSGCCGPHGCGPGAQASTALGYSADEMAAVPEGANMGLGCGNPQLIAQLREGEAVLDLGAGGGFDCFLAARQVGPSGQVIGVDMTPDMVSKARANATRLGTSNVDFRLGEIEHLPVADSSIDVIMSNCVVNLSPDKEAVFRDAFRVLKAGGRLAISDVVATAFLPDSLRGDLGAVSACLAGTVPVETIRQLLKSVGFVDIRVTVDTASREFIRSWLPDSGIEDHVASATIEARRPGADSCCAPSCCDEDTPA